MPTLTRKRRLPEGTPARTENVTAKITPEAKRLLEARRQDTPMSEFLANIIDSHLSFATPRKR